MEICKGDELVMSIPLIFIGIATATGAFGVGKTIKAGVDQKEANETNEKANYIIKKSTNKINKYRENCENAIENLGEFKIKVLDESIKPFISEFEKLSNIELTKSEGLDELGNIVLDKSEFKDLKKIQLMASSIIGGFASGTMCGALTAFGAYGAAGVFATASTGTVVLGGIVAGPALAVMGVVTGAKASANKDKAYTNLIKAEKYREEMDTASLLCSSIEKKANMFSEILNSLNSIFEPLICEMSNIIKNKGTNFSEFSEKEKGVIIKAMSIAGAIKSIIDTPILDKDGNITAKSSDVIENLKNKGLY